MEMNGYDKEKSGNSLVCITTTYTILNIGYWGNDLMKEKFDKLGEQE